MILRKPFSFNFPLLCFLIDGFNEDNHISGEYAAEAEHEAPGAVEGGVGGHPHAV